MSQAKQSASVRRILEAGNRAATVLENGLVRVMVDDAGGMVPELSTLVEESTKRGFLNAHWLPWFRGNAGGTFDPEKQAPFWKVKLLYDLAGNFPCVPNFGGGQTPGGADLPPHGWSANLDWQHRSQGTDAESGSAYALATMAGPDPEFPLNFTKIDALIPGERVHFTSLTVENPGKVPAEINIAWHNTVGSPFLQEGCRISGVAEAWTTAPEGGEFDTTGRLAFGTEFKSLDRAPLRGGGTVDISRVPGPVGYTDFAAGAIPASAPLGWSAVINPLRKLAYVCFFPGPAAAAEDEIALSFNELWMQYGGRDFTPWAAYDGGTDLTYCLGTENAVGAYAYGLSYSREHREILGAPTTVVIPAGEKKVLRYGTLFAPYTGTALDEGVQRIESAGTDLVCTGRGGAVRFAADPGFAVLKRLETLLSVTKLTGF